MNKWQGLNLDTNRGFHISDTLPGNVYTSAFREVNVYYPIIVSRNEDPEEQIQRLQRQIVKNLSYLYDPFPGRPVEILASDQVRLGFDKPYEKNELSYSRSRVVRPSHLPFPQ